MEELIYAGQKVEKLIREKYPQAVIEDASDYIHTERFKVEIDKASKEEFYSFAKKNGFIGECFGFLLRALRKKERW